MATGGVSQDLDMSLPVAKSAVEERNIVAAIDIGTTFSGYCYGIREEIKKDPTKVRKHSLPKTASTGLLSMKVPTCILFDNNRKFDSFGHEAKEKHAEICNDGKTWDWYFFQHFKMFLYRHGKLSRESKLEGVHQRELPVLLVFTESIRYLKDHLLQNRPDLKADEIHWVITVPAIWGDSSKQFMREAAIAADISSGNLSLALEPEAASIFCMSLSFIRAGDNDDPKLARFKRGSKYLVLDLGGGTTDITVHEVLDDGGVKELAKVNGGDVGGKDIDDKILSILTSAVGHDVMEVVQNRYADDYNDMINNSEVVKRTVKTDSTGWVKIHLPTSFSTTYNTMHNQQLSGSHGKDTDLKGKISFEKDKFKIKAEFFLEFFKEAGDKICSHLREQFAQLNDNDIDTIVMVGGFSESEIIRKKVENAFPNKRVIVPEDAGLAVLHGAVLFGFDPYIVKSRICKKTYGIQHYKHFEPALDPRDKLIVLNGHPLCKDAFDVHARIDDEFEVGEKAKDHKYVPSDPSTGKMVLNVYTSDKPYPMHIDQDGCENIGHMVVDFGKKDDFEGLSFKVQFEFGDTEMGVHATDEKMEKQTDATFDFLSRR